MKKLVLAVASVLLAGSLFAFAGCDNAGNTGVVKGNYKEATAAEATEAVKDIDMAKAFGDSTEEGYKVGLEAKMNLSFTMNYSMLVNSEALTEVKMDGSAKANYQVVAEPQGESVSIAGKGDLTASANMSMTAKGVKTETKSEVSANAYLDSEYLYLDAHVSSGENKNDAKMKIAFDDAIEMIMGQIGGAFALVEEAEAELPDMGITGGMDVSMNLGTAISALIDAGFTVSLDQSSGLKIKISAGKELILSAIKEAGDSIPFSVDAMEFSSDEIALYLSFDKEGKFVQAGFNVNVAAKMDTTVNGSGMKAEVNVKGGVEIKLFKGTVTLPEGLADYPTQSF